MFRLPGQMFSLPCGKSYNRLQEISYIYKLYLKCPFCTNITELLCTTNPEEVVTKIEEYNSDAMEEDDMYSLKLYSSSTDISIVAVCVPFEGTGDSISESESRFRMPCHYDYTIVVVRMSEDIPYGTYRDEGPSFEIR